MKKKRKIALSIIFIIVLSLVMTANYQPIKAMAAEWGHAIIGGLYGTTGVAIKTDAQGRVYVNMSGMSLIYTGAARGGTSTWVSTVSPLVTANIAFAYIKIANGSPGIHELPDAEDGQTITFQLLANPAYTIGEDTPGNMPRTGWNKINMTTINGWVTLSYIDDTVGWIITGADNVAIEY